ncbi:MAG: DUF1961 family protein, partial [Planctomycetota bacterium]
MKMASHHFCCCIVTIVVALLVSTAVMATDAAPRHPLVGKPFKPTDVDHANPMYETSFEDEAVLRGWRLEGGKQMSIADGKMLLQSQPTSDDRNHLVCWLTKEVPADFLLEFTVRPQDRKQGLNIVFFNARGLNGESIFDTSLQKRNGIF